ncbi:MAG: cell wall hydrolase [Blastomonas sp.]
MIAHLKQRPNYRAMSHQDRQNQPFARRGMTVREKLLSIALVISMSLGLTQMVGAMPEPESHAHARYQPQTGMAFERAGENFPGSAFYYLDDDMAALAPVDILDDMDAITPGRMPIAPALFATGSTTDKARALQCLTTAIYYEAALEPDAGQRAVAQVILNRLMHPSYPNTVCGVVYQGSERQSGCQFTFSCDGSMARRPDRFYWQRARHVAEQALAGKVYAPASLATHYHTTEVHPYWAPSLDFLGTIGAHRFYRWKGGAGQRSAFYQRYRGNEPLPGPKAKIASPASSRDLDPVALAKAYEESRLKAEADAAAISAARPGARVEQPASYAAPAYSAEAQRNGGERAYGGGNLPGAGSVKPEYQGSGQWISKPGS